MWHPLVCLWKCTSRSNINSTSFFRDSSIIPGDDHISVSRMLTGLLNQCLCYVCLFYVEVHNGITLLYDNSTEYWLNNLLIIIVFGTNTFHDIGYKVEYIIRRPSSCVYAHYTLFIRMKVLLVLFWYTFTTNIDPICFNLRSFLMYIYTLFHYIL